MLMRANLANPANLDAGYGQLHAPVVGQQRRVGAQLVQDELDPVPEALCAVAVAIVKCGRACEAIVRCV